MDSDTESSDTDIEEREEEKEEECTQFQHLVDKFYDRSFEFDGDDFRDICPRGHSLDWPFLMCHLLTLNLLKAKSASCVSDLVIYAKGRLDYEKSPFSFQYTRKNKDIPGLNNSLCRRFDDLIPFGLKKLYMITANLQGRQGRQLEGHVVLFIFDTETDTLEVYDTGDLFPSMRIQVQKQIKAVLNETFEFTKPLKVAAYVAQLQLRMTCMPVAFVIFWLRCFVVNPKIVNFLRGVRRSYIERETFEILAGQLRWFLNRAFLSCAPPKIERFIKSDKKRLLWSSGPQTFVLVEWLTGCRAEPTEPSFSREVRNLLDKYDIAIPHGKIERIPLFADDMCKQHRKALEAAKENRKAEAAKEKQRKKPKEKQRKKPTETPERKPKKTLERKPRKPFERNPNKPLERKPLKTLKRKPRKPQLKKKR